MFLINVGDMIRYQLTTKTKLSISSSAKGYYFFILEVKTFQNKVTHDVIIHENRCKELNIILIVIHRLL